MCVVVRACVIFSSSKLFTQLVHAEPTHFVRVKQQQARFEGRAPTGIGAA